MNLNELELRKEYFKYHKTLRLVGEACVSVQKNHISVETFFKSINTYIETAFGFFYIETRTDSYLMKKKLPSGVNLTNIESEIDRIVIVLNRIFLVSNIDYSNWPISDIYDNIDEIRKMLLSIF